MYTMDSCPFCRRFEREVAPVYARTREGAALRFGGWSSRAGSVSGPELKEPVIATPTFVLMSDGREAGRITGYLNDDMFWGLLGRLVAGIDAVSDNETFRSRGTMTAIVSKALENELRDGAEFSPELDQLMRKARKASDFLKALSHEEPASCCCASSPSASAVTELKPALAASAMVSQQLARLRLDQLVHDPPRREGDLLQPRQRRCPSGHRGHLRYLLRAGRPRRRPKSQAAASVGPASDDRAVRLGCHAAGVLVGVACGFTVRRARLCSFGAVEDAWMGERTRRLRIFGLALAVALTGTQALVGLGLLDPAMSTYVQPALPWLSIASAARCSSSAWRWSAAPAVPGRSCLLKLLFREICHKIPPCKLSPLSPLLLL